MTPSASRDWNLAPPRRESSGADEEYDDARAQSGRPVSGGNLVAAVPSQSGPQPLRDHRLRSHGPDRVQLPGGCRVPEAVRKRDAGHGRKPRSLLQLHQPGRLPALPGGTRSRVRRDRNPGRVQSGNEPLGGHEPLVRYACHPGRSPRRGRDPGDRRAGHIGHVVPGCSRVDSGETRRPCPTEHPASGRADAGRPGNPAGDHSHRIGPGRPAQPRREMGIRVAGGSTDHLPAADQLRREHGLGTVPSLAQPEVRSVDPGPAGQCRWIARRRRRDLQPVLGRWHDRDDPGSRRRSPTDLRGRRLAPVSPRRARRRADQQFLGQCQRNRRGLPAGPPAGQGHRAAQLGQGHGTERPADRGPPRGFETDHRQLLASQRQEHPPSERGQGRGRMGRPTGCGFRGRPDRRTGR